MLCAPPDGVCSFSCAVIRLCTKVMIGCMLRLTTRQLALVRLPPARWLPLEIGIPPFSTAMFTGKSDAIRAFVAAFAVPFPPVSTLSTNATVPCATILNHIVPAKRVPVRLAAFLAVVILEQFFERYSFTATRQLILGHQILLREGFVFDNILDGTEGEVADIYAVQGITAFGACAQFAARLVVFQTGAAFTLTT
jgi:hypothetical protein